MQISSVFQSFPRIARVARALSISYVCFDIFGGTERAPSRGHRARMQLPQTFCPLCDKQVIASALKATRAILGKP